ncbi:SDR family oxidoreductase [Thermodesulfobacteriota bacterium]
MRKEPVLVSGATGYVGGRLVPFLLDAGYRVRVLGRSLSKLESRPWVGHRNLEMMQADFLDYTSLEKAAKGCWVAFYLIHSMNPQHKDFAKADRMAAQNMSKAASRVGLERIIYLGGLGIEGRTLSKHLRSRTEVARILQAGSVPTTFLRAAMILGSGSASFEIMRYLVERLPVMITPRWVQNPVQPIAIGNVMGYLKGCLEHDEILGKTYDIGGPDILTYKRLMEIYAEEAGLKKRWIFPVPLLTPRLSSYWIHLITPVPSYIARPLAEGLRNPVVCQENRIQTIIPQYNQGCRETIRLALGLVKEKCVETCWADAGPITYPEWALCGDVPYAGGAVMELGYRVVLDATPEEVWESIIGIGGRRGWYSSRFLWALRGLIDRLVGGMGLRRGRADPNRLRPGDPVDFFRVLDVQKAERLSLLSEMKLPGEAILEFLLYRLKGEGTEIQQLSRFLPRGILGLVYWYVLYPFHQYIFKGMLRGIAQSVRRRIVEGPDRFAPRLPHICRIDPRTNT